jgi:hypothetical protein
MGRVDESDRKNHGACGHGKCDHRQIIKLKIKKLHKGLYLLTCRLTSKEIKKVADLALHVWVCLRECVKGCNPNTPLYIMLKYHIKISSMNSK